MLHDVKLEVTNSYSNRTCKASEIHYLNNDLTSSPHTSLISMALWDLNPGLLSVLERRAPVLFYKRYRISLCRYCMFTECVNNNYVMSTKDPWAE